jgi:hypothetical protein
VTQVQYNGLTPLGSQLDAKVVRPFVAGPVQARQLQKPVLVIVITGGRRQKPRALSPVPA